MRSIIEEIANAETQANDIRQGAVAEARELIQTTKSELEQAQAALELQERDATRAKLAEAEQAGKTLAEDMLRELGESADAQCRTARDRLDEAAAYLLKKVQEIA